MNIEYGYLFTLISASIADGTALIITALSGLLISLATFITALKALGIGKKSKQVSDNNSTKIDELHKEIKDQKTSN